MHTLHNVLNLFQDEDFSSVDAAPNPQAPRLRWAASPECDLNHFLWHDVSILQLSRLLQLFQGEDDEEVRSFQSETPCVADVRFYKGSNMQ